MSTAPNPRIKWIPWIGLSFQRLLKSPPAWLQNQRHISLEIPVPLLSAPHPELREASEAFYWRKPYAGYADIECPLE